MKKIGLVRALLMMVLAIGFVVSCNKYEATDLSLQTDSDAPVIGFNSAGVIPGQYIVVLKAATDDRSTGTGYWERREAVKTIAEQILDAHRIDISKIGLTYGTAIKGFVVQLTEAELQELRTDKLIDYIEQDQIVSLQGGPPGGGGGGGGGGGQQVPWGITRVGGAGDGTGKTAWIIDTGIDLDHEDLNVDVDRSISFLSGGGGNTSPDDANGHGTHVAGTIGAIDNGVGVVGVAANATVVAVRVLDRRGSGSYSGVIAGVDYVGANAGSGDVANMSLGGGVSTTLDNAVVNASNPCYFALAAGNESDHANNHSPARANGSHIYTVSAMDINDDWAYFSNYGNPPVDFCAPGYSIHSCWKDGGYNTISGTSMATPHVAGIRLLGNVGSDGTVNGDPDGNPDPIAHR